MGLIFAFPLISLIQTVTYLALIGTADARRVARRRLEQKSVRASESLEAEAEHPVKSLRRIRATAAASFSRNSTTRGSCQSADPTSQAAMRPSAAITNVAGMPSV